MAEWVGIYKCIVLNKAEIVKAVLADHQIDAVIINKMDSMLKNITKGYIAGIIGAALAHVIADLVAALVDPTMRARTLGIVLGGLLPLLLIPVLEKYVTKSKSHIMVGDHEDIEKDLKDEHHH